MKYEKQIAKLMKKYRKWQEVSSKKPDGRKVRRWYIALEMPRSLSSLHQLWFSEPGVLEACIK
eukprot:scaffold103600_cov38-Tisochrysis_lutea.AAC.3